MGASFATDHVDAPTRATGDVVRAAAQTWGPAAAILALQLAAYPLPLGVFVRGVLLGAVTALIALGMALIHRSARIVNFAQGDIGVAPAVLVFLLLSEWGWPYPVAVAAGAVSSFVLGGLVDLVFVRRFFRAPRLVLTVATIGIAQVLGGLALFLPRWFGVQGAFVAPRIDDPFDARIEIGDTIFRANSLIAAVVTPIVMVALIVVLLRTRLGMAIRASADKADLARLLGIRVKALSTVVWAGAGFLAFIAIFLRAGILGLPVGTGLSFGILLRSLTALLLGRMTNLVAIGASATALGVLELGIDWHQGDPLPLLGVDAPPLDAVLAVIIVVALLVRRAATTRTDEGDASSWTAAADVRPIPRELARLPEVRIGRGVGIGVVVAVLVALPHALPVDGSLKASALFPYAMVAMSMVVLTGWAGQVSLGQIAFFAIGAAVGAALTIEQSMDLLLVVPVAGAVGAVAACIVGLPALRSRGLYLGVTTFAFALATTGWLLDPGAFGWVPTQRVPRLPLLGRIDIDSSTRIYYVMLGGLVLTGIGLAGIRASRVGRSLVALRDNERAAAAVSIPIVRAKLTAFAVSGFVAAAAGALFVHHQQALGTRPYLPAENLAVFTMAVVGGITSLPGAVLGALYLLGARWFLPLDWQILTSGFGVLLVLLVLPGGLGGLVVQIRDLLLRSIATRRDLVVPSMLADVDRDLLAERREHRVAEAASDPRPFGSEPARPAPGRADAGPSGAVSGSPPSERTDAPSGPGDAGATRPRTVDGVPGGGA